MFTIRYKKNIKDRHLRIAIHTILEILLGAIHHTTSICIKHHFHNSGTDALILIFSHVLHATYCFVHFHFLSVQGILMGKHHSVSQPSYHCAVCMGFKQFITHWILLVNHAWPELQIQDDPPSFCTLWQHAAAAFNTVTFSSLHYSFLYHLLTFSFHEVHL
jgi:hypothetical protein